MAKQTSRQTILFSLPDVDAEQVFVRQLALQEGMNRPFVLELELDFFAEGDAAEWIRQQGAVAVLSADGEVVRRVAGIVTRVREHGYLDRAYRCISVTLESPLSLLERTRDFRIYQEMSTQDIVASVLEEAGIEASRIAFRLTGNYPVREVCTQFDETYFDFVSRLLEEDGIFYFFEFDDTGVTLVFGDSASALADGAVSEIPFRPAAGFSGGAGITEIREVERLRPAKVTLRDHDFKRPALDLEACAEGEAPGNRELYDYPGRYVEPDEGVRRAEARRLAMEQEASGARFVGGGWSITAGHKFKLIDAPASDLEIEWVPMGIEVTYEQREDSEELDVAMRVLPADTTLRPPLTRRRPRVPGPQIAKVRGPSGSEIHVDEYGRVKVAFPWDRRCTHDEQSSCWVRVGQMFMSGALAIPRVGWEVLVDFEDGDPDKPFVLGRVYNALFSPPYQLPDGKTMTGLKSLSSPGGGGQNEIRLEDAAGDEQIAISSQKDTNVVIANNRTETIVNSEGRLVGSNQSVTIGANRTTDVGASSQLAVGGSQTWTVGASRTKTVSATEKVSVGGSRSLTIGGSHTQLTPMSIAVSTGGSFSETVGGSCIEAAVLEVGTAVAGAASLTVGAAKIEASGSGASDMTIGAHATTVGGALISAAGSEMNLGTGGVRATTVGGAWVASAGGDVQLTGKSAISITVGGAVALNAGKIVLEVGGSNVTVAAGAVSIKSSKITIKASGPMSQLAPLVEDK